LIDLSSVVSRQQNQVISIVANFMTRTSLQTVTMERATTPTKTTKTGCCFPDIK